jgi:PHD/YefM family antitoxin component YafN of YafNO toxin-antitoxin module
MIMGTRRIPLTRARVELGRLARKDGLAPGEVVEVTRRGVPALVLQRAEDYARLRQQKTRRLPRLWGSLTIIGDLEAASERINARLQERFWHRRAR